MTLPTWPLEHAAEALATLARQAGYAPRVIEGQPPAPPTDPDELELWVERAATALGLEVETISISYPAVSSVLRVAPLLVRVTAIDGPGALLAIRRLHRGKVELVDPAGAVHRAPVAAVVAAISSAVDASVDHEVEPLVRDLPGAPARVARVRAALRWERLKLMVAGIGFMLRSPPTEPLAAQWRAARLSRRLLVLVAGYLAGYALTVAGWTIIGRSAFSGRFDVGLATAWLLVLLTAIPVALFTSWQSSLLSVEAGALLKRTALAGALELEIEPTRTQGAGQLLGHVLEIQAVEALAAGGAFLGLAAIFELSVAAVVLALGGWWGAFVVLGIWLGVTAALAAVFAIRRRRWTVERLDLTHDLVERMVGQRTRLVQEAPERWHIDEDRALEAYLAACAPADRAGAHVRAIVARGWLVAGIVTLAPAFLAAAGPASLAIGVGGVLLAYQGFTLLASSLPRLVDGAIAWRVVRPILGALARAEAPPPLLLPAPRRRDGDVVVAADQVSFGYARRSEPVLRRCDLTIRRGERWLLLGRSGSGKSTLGSLLVGLRQPTSGLVLLDGLDRATLGRDGWRRRAAAAPQFHENHVLSGTFAFNALMGRRWPATGADLAEAEQVCRELGLGPLLDRMPSGMDQVLGETGWRLSHGERSRLFIARALLQDAELLLLDESFAALDPETLRVCLDAVLRRARTLVVIAHP